MVVHATTGFGAKGRVLRLKPNQDGPFDTLDTTFRTPKGNFYYTVMLFRLKNANATYQRATMYILDDLIHHLVECNIDDMVVKTKERKDHQDDLLVLFKQLR